MGANIDWTFPGPRSGLAGIWDRFIGPGATRAELAVQVAAAALGCVGAVAIPYLDGLDWPVWKYALAGLFGFDLMGGVATNATSTAKRWYHRQGQGFAQHLGFVAVHVAHVFVVAWVFRDRDWAYFGAVSAYLLAASIGILAVPLYLQRSVALVLYAVVAAGARYVFVPTAGLEWFVPVFFLKLLVSHLVREEPYRPLG